MNYTLYRRKFKNEFCLVIFVGRVFTKNYQNYEKKNRLKLPSHIKQEQDFQAIIKLLHLLEQNISSLGSQTKRYVRISPNSSL